MRHALTITRKQLWFGLIALLAISFPWSEHINSVLIILLGVHWIADRNLVQKLRKIPAALPLILPFWLFFFAHLIFIRGAAPDLEQTIMVKLSFLLFPLFFATELYLDTRLSHRLLWLFSFSCLAVAVYCVFYYYVHYQYLYGWSLFTNRMYFGIGIMHPGWFSNYFLAAVIFLSLRLLHYKDLPARQRVLAAVLIILFLVVLFILVSKTAMIVLFLFIIYLVWQLIKGFRMPYLKPVLFIFFAGICLLIYSRVPSVQERILETRRNLANMEHRDIPFNNSTGSRWVAWKIQWTLVKARILSGYGTGNANRIFFNVLKHDGYTDLVKHNMHTHNQFLHTWLDLGITGVVLLSFFFIFLLWHFRNREPLALWLSILLLCNCLTDDALEIQAVIVFSLFFITLYVFKQRVQLEDLEHKFVPHTPDT